MIFFDLIFDNEAAKVTFFPERINLPRRIPYINLNVNCVLEMQG